MGGVIFWIIIILGFIFFSNSSSGPTSEAEYVPVEETNSADEEVDASTDTDTFGGYECTEDCSGHEAGYEWASDNDISHTDDCSGNSDSFIEGCMSYVQEYYPEEVEEE